jgi:sigma-54 specific flagellar transcriptional regulator A
MAEGGTLLLEDIEALSIQSQASLLAYLRTSRLERIGSVRGIASDIRLLTSSSIDLGLLVEQGEFREDLYYAIRKLVVRVPPLRDYVATIRQTPASFELNFEPGVLDESVWEVLCAYSWPGNLVELAACAQQLAMRDHGAPISRDDLPEQLRDSAARSSPAISTTAGEKTTNNSPLLPVNGLDLKEYLAELEKNLITQALEDTGSVVARAADRLHVRRTTLVEKMRKYGLQRG